MSISDEIILAARRLPEWVKRPVRALGGKHLSRLVRTFDKQRYGPPLPPGCTDTVVVIDIPSRIGFGTVLKAAQSERLRGYAFLCNQGTRLLVERYSGSTEVVDALYNTLRERFEFNLVPGAVFPELPPVQPVDIAVSPPLGVGWVDSVDANGNLSGWATPAPDGHTRVRVHIDGKPAGQTMANIFRVDLLKAGLGLGSHGFRFRPPDEFLDGRPHEIAIEGGAHRQTLVLPFHFNRPRPWLGQERIDVAWNAEDEALLQSARWQVIHGEGGVAALQEILQRKPFAIFRDLGLHEAHAQRGQKMPSFKARLDERISKLYGARVCTRPDCCKREPLSYDAARCSELIDRCPLLMRHFVSKLVVKAYASRFNIRVPRTLRVVSSAADLDDFAFPDRYVLKPEADSGQGLYLMHHGLNLFDGLRYTRDALRSKVVEYLAQRRESRFIVEEFLAQEGIGPSEPIVPLDYKMHAFGGKVRIIHVDDRNTVSRDPWHRRQAWLSRDWVGTPFRMRVAEQESEPIRRPACFDAMLQLADSIATNLKDYIRVDLYATDSGPVLSELTTYTHAGVGFTDYGAMILAQAWHIFEDREALP